jgi:hypothetical protein
METAAWSSPAFRLPSRKSSASMDRWLWLMLWETTHHTIAGKSLGLIGWCLEA